VLSNRGRVLDQRARLLAEHGAEIANVAGVSEIEPANQTDAFYAAWVDELVRSAVESLLVEYNQSGRSDYFRVLYSRLCEELSISAIAELLAIKVTSVENYYRHARQRLMEKLQEVVRRHVHRYAAPGNEIEEFQAEWSGLGEYLKQHGGLEQAVRRAYLDFDPAARRPSQARLAAGSLPLTTAAVEASAEGNSE
jgi:hypothetical protein